ncbi:MATE family efflux transporter [Streptococcus sp. 2A/TPW/M5]
MKTRLNNSKEIRSLCSFGSLVYNNCLLLFATPILALLGAKGAVLEMATQYVQILALGSLFQIAGQGTNPLLRNQGKPWIAMAMMILNFVLDTSLSGIFTLYLGYGVAGAAIASVIGQGMAFLPILYLLFNKSNRVPLSAYKLSTERVQKL